MAGGTQYAKPRKLSVLANYEKAVTAAFKWDCEAFLERFEKENKLNYADFANIWQLTNFTYIYADQTFVGPLKVLCDACFMTVKKYLMFQESLYINVGAFYLLYGLYYKQPIEGLVKIRLTLAEYKKIKTLMDEMVNRAQFDIIYIFAKMKSDNVFLYTAELRPINIELNKSLKTLTHLDDTFQTRGSESSIIKFKDILEDETVQALQKTSSEYDSLLQKYAEKYRSVLQFKSTLIDDLKQAHSKVFAQDPKEPESIQSEEYRRRQVGSSRRSIRLKAMQNQNAEYRGSKKVLTAMDMGEEDDEFDEITQRKTTKRRSKLKSGKNKNAEMDLSSEDDESD